MGSSIYENNLHFEGEDDVDAAACMVSLLSCTTAVPMALKAAIELNILEIIKRAGPGAHLSPAEIVARLPTTNPLAASTLDRIMRFLACYQVLTCSLVATDAGGMQRRYGLAPVCRLLTADENGISLAPFVLMHQLDIFSESWQYLKDAVLDGGDPFSKAHGVTLFEYNSMNPQRNKLFNQVMHNYSTIFVEKMLNTYKGFEGIETLVDVGGGIGAILRLILSRYPEIKGINFDQPHVIANAPRILGAEHVGGDMFVSVPRGDAILIKWILHDWSDEQCLQILKNCWEALPSNGKVIIIECIAPDAPKTTSTTRDVFLRDLVMMIHCTGGKERSKKEFESLAKRAGFSELKTISCALNNWIMELYK